MSTDPPLPPESRPRPTTRQDVGNAVRKLRQEKGLSLEAFAGELQMSVSNLKRIEAGNGAVSTAAKAYTSLRQYHPTLELVILGLGEVVDLRPASRVMRLMDQFFGHGEIICVTTRPVDFPHVQPLSAETEGRVEGERLLIFDVPFFRDDRDYLISCHESDGLFTGRVRGTWETTVGAVYLELRQGWPGIAGTATLKTHRYGTTDHYIAFGRTPNEASTCLTELSEELQNGRVDSYGNEIQSADDRQLRREISGRIVRGQDGDDQ